MSILHRRTDVTPCLYSAGGVRSDSTYPVQSFCIVRESDILISRNKLLLLNIIGQGDNFLLICQLDYFARWIFSELFFSLAIKFFNVDYVVIVEQIVDRSSAM